MYLFVLVFIFVKLLVATKTGEWQLTDKKGSFVNYDNTNTWYELNEKNKKLFTYEPIKLNTKNQIVLEDKSRGLFLKISGKIMLFSYNKDDILQDDFSQILHYGKWIIVPNQKLNQEINCYPNEDIGGKKEFRYGCFKNACWTWCDSGYGYCYTSKTCQTKGDCNINDKCVPEITGNSPMEMISTTTLSSANVQIAEVVKSSINWQPTGWAFACDFINNDLKNVIIAAPQCGPTCVSTSGCTHFTWTSYQGGTCWMKSGSVSRSDAISIDDQTTVCGIVPEKTVASTKPPIPLANVKGYRGCYADSDDSELPFQPFLPSSNLTIEICIVSCRKNFYPYAGLKAGSTCLCGQIYGGLGRSNDCNLPCSGDLKQICGGLSTNSIYETKQKTTISNKMTTSNFIKIKHVETLLDTACGLLRNLNTEKIVGGIKATKSWGWQVLFQFAGKMCGGSLISNEWILTAAHCVNENPDPNDYTVSVGIHDLSKPSIWSKTNLKIAKILKHPDYNKYTYQNDIALVKLSSTLSFDTDFNVFPVCIPIDLSTFDFSKQAYATGWGKTGEDLKTSNMLMEVHLDVLSDNDCRERAALLTKFFNETTQTCAGHKGVDTCQGDSGGPLVIKGPDERWYLLGITSFGPECGKIGGIYTKTILYKEWILKNIK